MPVNTYSRNQPGIPGRKTARRHPAGRMAVLVEALFLLAVLSICLAVIVGVFAAAGSAANKNTQLEGAILAAQNAAEDFAAAPDAFAQTTSTTSDGLIVVTEITDEPRASGTLRRAHISVFAATPDGVEDGAAAQEEPSPSNAGAAAGEGAQPATEASCGSVPTAGDELIFSVDTSAFVQAVAS